MVQHNKENLSTHQIVTVCITYKKDYDNLCKIGKQAVPL